MKSREHVTTNGRAVFYASMWEDLKNAALDCGWALGLHGSLNDDMDIMAMPWVENPKSPDDLVAALCKCFTDDTDLRSTTRVSADKPNNRIVYTLMIWADFYLDINIISPKINPVDLDFEEIRKVIEGGIRVGDDMAQKERWGTYNRAGIIAQDIKDYIKQKQ